MSSAAHLAQPVNFGGIMVPLGHAIATMRAEGHDERLIDRWTQGALLARTI